MLLIWHFYCMSKVERQKTRLDPIFDPIFDSSERGKLDENQKNPYFIVKNNFAKLSLEEHGLIRVYRES